MFNENFAITSLTEILKAFIVILTCLILIKGNISIIGNRIFSLTLTAFGLVLCTMWGSLLTSNEYIVSAIYIGVILVLLKLVFKLNIVQAILSAILSLNILVTCQLVTSSFEVLYLKDMFITNDFILTIPVFILQSIGLVLAKRFTLKNNVLLRGPWNDLTRNRKYTIIVLIGFLYFAFNINIYFAHLYRNYDNYHTDINYIQRHLNVFFIQSIVISYTSLLFIKRTLVYENYKLVFKTPAQTYKTLLYSSTKNDIRGYLRLLDSVSMVSLSDFVSYINKYKSKYFIDLNLMCYEQLGNYNFYDHFVIIRELFSTLNRIAVLSIHIDIKCLENGISMIIKVNLNDLDKHRFLKLYRCNDKLNTDKHILSSTRDNYIEIIIKEGVLC